jgi:hypothetical protein
MATQKKAATPAIDLDGNVLPGTYVSNGIIWRSFANQSFVGWTHKDTRGRTWDIAQRQPNNPQHTWMVFVHTPGRKGSSRTLDSFFRGWAEASHGPLYHSDNLNPYQIMGDAAPLIADPNRPQDVDATTCAICIGQETARIAALPVREFRVALTAHVLVSQERTVLARTQEEARVRALSNYALSEWTLEHLDPASVEAEVLTD